MKSLIFFLFTKFYARKKLDQGQNCEICLSWNPKSFQVVNILPAKSNNFEVVVSAVLPFWYFSNIHNYLTYFSLLSFHDNLSESISNHQYYAILVEYVRDSVFVSSIHNISVERRRICNPVKHLWWSFFTKIVSGFKIPSTF